MSQRFVFLSDQPLLILLNNTARKFPRPLHFHYKYFGDVPGSNILCCAYSVSARSDNRFLAEVIVHASIESGLATGNPISNYLTRYYGYTSSYLLATVALVIDLLYALIVIPPPDDKSKEDPGRREYDLQRIAV